MAMISSHTQFHPAFRVATLYRALAAGVSVYRQRQHLKTLDDSRLRDLGISYAQAHREAHRPVWNVPTHWMRRTF